MPITLEADDGTAVVEELPDGRRKINVTLKESAIYTPYRECVTSYPLDLIEFMLKMHGAVGLCAEILRDEDPQYVQKYLKNDLSAYFSERDFEGKEILEFGCGSGASTVILARMFPKAKITAVELFDTALSVARRRAAFHNLSNVKFLLSPSGTELPEGIGQFDFIIMSAVYEHLLPDERPIIMRKLWQVLREEGYLFINQTPNILFPFELHTTMLPMINYLPDKMAFKYARLVSKRVAPNDTWEELLRKGIRGATVREILRNLPKEIGIPLLLEPKNNGLKDRIDLYYENTNQNRLKSVKQAAKFGIKAIYKIFGTAIIPDLSLAIKKLSARD